ncbi:MAG: caspase family protein [Oscillatoria princeps RMCB-10]|jgi:hypothetical protein|nr:caspase family protein [Oscillatoria princeps RMCB-10]
MGNIKRQALVVGINRYSFLRDVRTGLLLNLEKPAGDAEAIAQLLEKPTGELAWSVRRLPEVSQNDKFKVGDAATVSQVDLENAIKELFQPEPQHVPDVALLFFAGHGLRRQQDGQPEGFLATSDANGKTKWGVSLIWLRKVLLSSPVKQQIVWLDCCHSGEVLNFLTPEELRDWLSGGDRLLIASCRSDREAYALGEHGVLTKVLLQGLDPMQYSSGEWITSRVLAEFIEKQLDNNLVLKRQIPLSRHFGEQILFWKGAKEPISKIGLIIGVLVVIIFIFLFFNPQEATSYTARILRLIACVLAAIAASLVLESLSLETEIPLKKWQIKFTGSLTISVAVFIAFYYGLPTLTDSQGYIRKEKIQVRHLTALNEYPTLSLVEPTIPEKLTQILGLENPPIIYTKNPIFESLENFKTETGNETLISEYDYEKYAQIGYSSNINDRTTKGGYAKGRQHRESVFSQSRDNFESTTAPKNGEKQKFGYAPIKLPLQQSKENSKWTTILINNLSNKSIVQFPELAALKDFGLLEEDRLDLISLNDSWIRKIIENNPHIRGFIAYLYPYIENLADNFIHCGVGVPLALVQRVLPEPYVRFIDIVNISNSSINIDSINYKIIENNPYKLTVINNRNTLFENIPIASESMGITIPPKQHLFIPIEFGFDTKVYSKINFSQLIDFKNIIGQTVYVARVPDKKMREKIKLYNSTHSLEPILMGKEIMQILTEPIKIDRDWVSTSIEEIVKLIPHRFSVGSVMNVTSLVIDGKTYDTTSPLNEPKFSLSVYFAYGSCPYLLVYNSHNRDWTELGTVLYGRHDKSLQAYETYNLGEHISKIKLEEREPEITYIDSLSVLYTDPITKTMREAIPPISKLEKNDGEYFILHQDESIEINFKDIIPKNALDIRLKINGYYEVLLDNDLRTNAESM